MRPRARRRVMLNLNLETRRVSLDASSRRAPRDSNIDSESDRPQRSMGRPTATPLDEGQGHIEIPFPLISRLFPGLLEVVIGRSTPVTDVGHIDSAEITPRNQRRRRDLDPQPPSVNTVGATSSTLHVEHVAPPPSPPPLSSQPLVPTYTCSTCLRPMIVEHVAPPPSPPPLSSQPLVPTYPCSICLEPMIGEAMSTKCGHLFCDSCIRIAISDQAKCPLCRCTTTEKELLRIFFPTPF